MTRFSSKSMCSLCTQLTLLTLLENVRLISICMLMTCRPSCSDVDQGRIQDFGMGGTGRLRRKVGSREGAILWLKIVHLGVYSDKNSHFITPIAGLTRCSAIAERPRCRVRYSFRQK